MLARAVCRRRLLPAELLRSMPLDLPILEPLSAVSRMVALVSHDLRHPLTAILANAEFLTQPDISEMERSEFYDEIRCAIDRMNELVSSLLECSRGRDTLRPGARNIVDTVERAIRMTSVRPEFRRITKRPRNMSASCGNNLCANQLETYGTLSLQAVFRHGFEDGRSTDQPAYVSHARRRLVLFWRNAHAHAFSEKGSPLFLPVRDIDRVGYRTCWNRNELSD
jgi:signal transduction histidine kinase